MTSQNRMTATINGMLLLGKNPKRLLTQSASVLYTISARGQLMRSVPMITLSGHGFHCGRSGAQRSEMVRRLTTGLGLSGDEAFVGLVDYGLFSEKLPPCFTSQGLSDHVPTDLLMLTTENDPIILDKLLKKRAHDFIRYELLREVNTPRQMGVPHPESHVVQCLALKRHWAKIKRHCAKPETPVSRLFVRKISVSVYFG